MKGIVFDIQRFALHDGPGIRTTIFLKGCPLRCEWCHNPESFLLYPQYQKITVHGEKVRKLVGEEKSIDELIVEVLKDKDYFDESGGGVTISGGEPMFQFEFTKELLKRLKKENIHTCLDTSGFAKWELFEEILPYIDLFHYDFKLADSAKHKKYTGQNNELILGNLHKICKKEIPLILRCPIIPNVNDNEEHSLAIANFAKKYSHIEVDKLEYHNMARKKKSELENIDRQDTFYG